MSIWQTILDDFVELLEVDCAPTLYNSMHHPTSGLDILKLPDTTLNGAYSIEFNGISEALRDINPYITFTSDVKLRIGFVINSEAKADPDAATTDPVNDKVDYSQAVEDIFLIIKKRLDVTTYIGVLDFVSFVSCSNLVFQNDTENYAYCDIIFRVGKQETV